MENRQTAYEKLIELAEKQGYVTFDNIMDCADEYSLPIQDFDWLSNSITTRGILVYSEAPTRKANRKCISIIRSRAYVLPSTI